MSELKCYFKEALPIESGVSKAGKEFTKRSFVCESGGQYSRLIVFGLFGDKCNLVDGLFPGKEITVKFDPESRQWNDKYFTDLKCYEIG